jgi:ubiquinone/menaquinone biosynthesis C-methylase UbiE
MLERARPRAQDSAAEIVFVAADSEALPFRDGSFVEGVVGLAMCTIPHPERALAELRRTVAPGGRLRLLEHVRVNSPVIGRLQDWLTPLWRRIAGGCRLNRRTVETVAVSGFVLECVTSHLGGYVLEIVARSP